MAAEPNSHTNAVTQPVRPVDSKAADLKPEVNDLRGPLESVRESIRVIRHGDLGPVTEGQQICLGSAIEQCDGMEQTINEMIQWHRLQASVPHATRRWISVRSLREQFDPTLQPWLTPRNVTLLWDIADERIEVFADPSWLRRLVVSLVTAALGRTLNDGQILIRLQPEAGRSLRWSVIDWGHGIDPRELQRQRDANVPRPTLESTGYASSQRLAALHFSSLEIRSRIGRATEVTFQTPIGGPANVAERWTQWRDQVKAGFSPARQLPRPTHNQPSGLLRRPPVDTSFGQAIKYQQRTLTPPHREETHQHVRVDSPMITLKLNGVSSPPRFDDRFTAVVVAAGAAVSREAAERFERLLHRHTELYDLLYPINARRWIWICDADGSRMHERIAEVSRAANIEIPELRIDWAKPQTIRLDQGRAATRLSDLLVRQTLGAAAHANLLDHDEVRPGTAPLRRSARAASRLDEELSRLVQRMHCHVERLQRQRTSLRPG